MMTTTFTVTLELHCLLWYKLEFFFFLMISKVQQITTVKKVTWELRGMSVGTELKEKSFSEERLI